MKDQETLEGRASIISDCYLKTGNEMLFKTVLGKSKFDKKFELKNHRRQFVRATGIL